MDHPPVIGLCSEAPGHGKSTVASLIKDAHPEAQVIPFAETLKAMVEVFLRQLGVPEDRLWIYEHLCKEDFIPEAGVTYRHLCQTLGTEWGRSCIHPEIWLRCWEAQAGAVIAYGTLVIVDDVRFPNEAELVGRMGGEMWKVHRPQATKRSEEVLAHPSEGGIPKELIHRVLENDGGLEQLQQVVRALLQSGRSQVEASA